MERLQEQMNILITTLDKYKENPSNKTALRTLKVFLRRESVFPEIKRAYVRKMLNEFPRLREYLE